MAIGRYQYAPNVYYELTCYEYSTNPAANISTVRILAYVKCDSGAASSSGGGGQPGNWTRGWTDISSGGSFWVLDTYVDVAHNADGSGAYSVDGQSGFAGWGTTPVITASVTLTDFVRVPTTPTFTSGPTRTVRSVAATLSAVTFYGSGGNYYMDYSKDGGAYTGQQSSPTRSFTFPALTDGSTYVFRGYGMDSEGMGGVVSSTVVIPTVPSAPNSITVTAPAGRSVTVTSGAASDGGAAITGYYVQASPDNGTTWLAAQAMTSQSYTYTNLNGGATYKFRVYATNEMGQGAYTTTASGTFIPSLGKRYDLATTSWVSPGIAKRYDQPSLAFVSVGISKKYIAGTGWVDFV